MNLILLWLFTSLPFAGPVIDLDQFESMLRQAPVRVELDFHQGKVFEVEIERDTRSDDKIRDRVLRIDRATQTLHFENAGALKLDHYARTKLPHRGYVPPEVFLSELESLQQHAPVWLKAKGSFGKDGFIARKVKVKKPSTPEIKASISWRDYDPSTKTLTIGPLHLPIGEARIKLD